MDYCKTIVVHKRVISQTCNENILKAGIGMIAAIRKAPELLIDVSNTVQPVLFNSSPAWSWKCKKVYIYMYIYIVHQQAHINSYIKPACVQTAYESCDVIMFPQSGKNLYLPYHAYIT